MNRDLRDRFAGVLLGTALERDPPGGGERRELRIAARHGHPLRRNFSFGEKLRGHIEIVAA
ncbi:MAG: hypothetical protein ABIP39_01505, partial [Polyangiaceae bacterium]